MVSSRGVALASVILVGCASGGDERTCVSVVDCLLTESCVDSICVPKDAGPQADAGVDAGRRDGSTAGRDAGAPIDAGTDSGPPEIDAGPSCTDRLRNGDETDVDCGGSCDPCAECGVCTADADCVRGRCAAGRCQLRQEVYVDWVAHCSTDGSASLELPGLPAGDYRVTALESAQTVWNPPYSPPATGWFWRFACAGLSVPSVATPSGMRYATETDAFAALTATTEVASFEGGTLRCATTDSNCTDNHGGSRFALERVCPP